MLDPKLRLFCFKMVEMKLIPLSMGLYAKVDDEWFDYLMQWNWYAEKGRHTYYAVRNGSHRVDEPKHICMHRVILGMLGSKNQVDHEDRDGLNNQYYNIREATHGQNQWNKPSQKNSSSKYIGVYWCNTINKWISRIMASGKEIKLGSFDSEETAARVRDTAAKIHHGKFASLNFPEPQAQMT